VHFHILPRKRGDFERNDDIYEKLEVRDERAPRTLKEMEEEATWLASIFKELAL
jgi:hypothetical protein